MSRKAADPVSARNLFGIILLLAGAMGSWYLASSLDQGSELADAGNVAQQGFYLRDARILGTGENGNLLYEIEADYAEQQNEEQIAFDGVKVRYTTASEIPWSLSADRAVISGNQDKLTLSGHVLATSEQGFEGDVTEISTDWLALEPEKYIAYTDRRVRIRIGDRSISATGMEASLQDNRLQLKSNVSGKFVP
ncbi:MAG: LPS export ABC transporter periplasmic protein LptC [Woeseia sp.]|nr:LPS export ABC transporter periplasmic protein LptC [Woeseia sp.]MBT8095564.1 LPS export ABC transporter periplasmic protein LptC [Woeseia sp.]NNE61266.1 LPS export ABC transporter periplasmic protein LptC [Woeseia sp.]NNL53560.1 LPS export ABC transporter periplasmic protein LptC [Woeseia sp.]